MKQKSFVGAAYFQKSVSYKSIKLFSAFKNGQIRLDQIGSLENNAILQSFFKVGVPNFFTCLCKDCQKFYIRYESFEFWI